MGTALSRAAGEWLRGRRIKALGVDLATPDAHSAMDLPIHMNFLRPRSIGLPDDEYILIVHGPDFRFSACLGRGRPTNINRRAGIFAMLIRRWQRLSRERLLGLFRDASAGAARSSASQ